MSKCLYAVAFICRMFSIEMRMVAANKTLNNTAPSGKIEIKGKWRQR